MIGEKDAVVYMGARPQRMPAGDAGAQALHLAASRLAEVGRAGPRLRTKDLVGLLLSHGARTWRGSFPVAVVRLRVLAPNGKPAVKISLD